MRTSLSLPDDLLASLRQVAEERRMPMSELAEEAIRSYLAGPGKAKKFSLADGTFSGDLGLQPELNAHDWSQIRCLNYEGPEPW